MGALKYDKFYYVDDKSSKHLVNEIFVLKDEEYYEKYKDRIYCPSCEKVKLALTHRNDYKYLKGYPKHLHDLECPYNFDIAENKVIEKYVNKLRNKGKIKSLLDSVVRLLLFPKLPRHNDVDKNDFKEPLFINTTKNKKTVTKKRIPHYSFKSWGANIPQNQLFVFYGKVHISQFVNKNIEYLHIKDIKTSNIITSCIKPNNIIICDGDYNLVALGKCIPHKKEKDNDTKIYYNLQLNEPIESAISLVEIK